MDRTKRKKCIFCNFVSSWIRYTEMAVRLFKYSCKLWVMVIPRLYFEWKLKRNHYHFNWLKLVFHGCYRCTGDITSNINNRKFSFYIKNIIICELLKLSIMKVECSVRSLLSLLLCFLMGCIFRALSSVNMSEIYLKDFILEI